MRCIALLDSFRIDVRALLTSNSGSASFRYSSGFPFQTPTKSRYQAVSASCSGVGRSWPSMVTMSSLSVSTKWDTLKMASKVLAGREKRRSESRQEEHGSLKSFRRSRKTKEIFGGESLHDLGCTGSAVLSRSYTLIVTVSSFRVAEK